MIKYQVLQGVRLPQATALPSVVPTPEGKAMGAIPGWSVLIDPSYKRGDEALNRARGSYLESALHPVGAAHFPGSGEAAFSLTPGLLEAFVGDVSLSGEAWSVFAVTRPDLSLGSSKHILSSVDISEPYAAILSFSSNGLTADVLGGPSGPSDSRIQYAPAEPFDGRTLLIMWTFSVRDGLRIFDNGRQGAHEPSQTQPLNHSVAPGQWRFFNGALGGLVGMAGVLDIDLGWPEHAGYRRAIERFLMGKYGISA